MQNTTKKHKALQRNNLCLDLDFDLPLNARMAKKKTKTEAHLNPQFPLRLPRELREMLNKLAQRNARKATEEARTAIREHLERAGMWPPKPIEDTK